jgi:predicted NAD/FAD-binding protein
VAGGARQYVRKIAERLACVRSADPVLEVTRHDGAQRVSVRSARGIEQFDHVVLACHSDQSLAILSDADRDERSIVGDVRYQRNRAILHTDTRLMPQSRKVWSAWNYSSGGADEPAVAVTYLLNKLQPLPVTTPVLVSLNPLIEPRADQVIAEFDYAHPVFDGAAIRAQQRLAGMQGRRRVWFAGAWTGYGFHEDGLKSGLAVAQALLALGRQAERLAA